MPRALLFVLLVFTAPLTPAEECYSVDAGGSVSFEVKQAGAPFRGTFRRFGGTLCLVQERVVRIDVWLEPASVTTALPEIDATLKDKEFFDVAAFPRITFGSSAVEPRGDRQLARGTLAIKGKRGDVEVPFRLGAIGGRPFVAGSITLNRLDYAVGTGEWSDTRWLASDVRIEFNVALSSR